MRYAVIDTNLNVVVDVIVGNDNEPSDAIAGYLLFQSDNGQIGYVWDGNKIIIPVPPKPEKSIPTITEI